MHLHSPTAAARQGGSARGSSPTTEAPSLPTVLTAAARPASPCRSSEAILSLDDEDHHKPQVACSASSSALSSTACSGGGTASRTMAPSSAEEEAAAVFMVAAEASTGRKLTTEQRQVVNAVFHGRNVVMIGPGGTGKSMLLEMLLKFWKAKSRYVTTVAPYGRAARNIDGVTVHSAFGLCVFGLKTRKSPLEFARFIERHRPEVYANYTDTEVLVIDEIGCLTPRNWTRLDDIARHLRQEPLKPFGGMQLLISGDFYQAVPILDKEDMAPLPNGKPSPHFVFQTALWKQCKFVKVVFDKVFRQTKLADAQLLNAFRRGDLTPAHKQRLHECVRDVPEGEKPTKLYFNNREVDAENRRQLELLAAAEVVFKTDVKFDLSKLPRNVFDCNAALMRADGTCVNDPPASGASGKHGAASKRGRGGRGGRGARGGRGGAGRGFSMSSSSVSDLAQAAALDMQLASAARSRKKEDGDTSADDHDLYGELSWGEAPLPSAKRDSDRMKKLTQLAEGVFNEHPYVHKMFAIKPGAKVMLRQNLHLKMGLVNGLIGTVIRAELGKAQEGSGAENRPVTLRDAVLEVQWDNCPLVPASYRVPVTTMRYGLMGVGFVELTAFPITLAWALTADAAQGLALDSLVVNLGERCRPHMAYVALSRAKDLDKVYLTGWHPKCIVVSSEVREFMDQEANDAARKEIRAFASALDELPNPSGGRSSSSSTSSSSTSSSSSSSSSSTTTSKVNAKGKATAGNGHATTNKPPAIKRKLPTDGTTVLNAGTVVPKKQKALGGSSLTTAQAVKPVKAHAPQQFSGPQTQRTTKKDTTADRHSVVVGTGIEMPEDSRATAFLSFLPTHNTSGVKRKAAASAPSDAALRPNKQHQNLQREPTVSRRL